MQGRTCVVTGATSGIGEATALALARKGAHVVIVGREPGRARAVAQRTIAMSGSSTVDCLAADLSLMRETRALAEEIVLRFPRVDVLVNNAGAMFRERAETDEGLEKTLTVEYLSAFLLATTLRSTLEASAPARVVNVVCAAHLRGKLDFDDLQMRKNYSPMRAHARAKLALVMFTYQLARRLDDRSVIVNAIDPGTVRTKLGCNEAGHVPLARQIAMATRGISPEEAAQAIVHVASEPSLARVSGEYFDRGGPTLSSEESYDEAAARRLWRVSEALTGSVVAQVRDDRSGPRLAH
jgi:NAD(P)-dependent dehydrogenase (short-subunit alcohol dehydrogenase family)